MIVTRNEYDFIKYDSHDICIEINNRLLIIRYPNITYSYWKGLKDFNTDNDIVIILMNILVELDCSITFSNQRLLFTNNMMYDYHISQYYYYLLRLNNQLTYNAWFDMLIEQHNNNIVFEINNPIIPNTPKAKTKKVVKAKGSNKFIRQITTDLITGNETYIYSNSKTGETINSSDPNLLDSLNGVKPKKEKKVKSVGVPLTNMVFSFNKKKS